MELYPHGGGQVDWFEITEFYKVCSPFQRRMYKLGADFLKYRFDECLVHRLRNFLKQKSYDIVYMISGAGLPREAFELLAPYNTYIQLLDGIKRFKHLEADVSYFKHVYCFDYDDVSYLTEKYPNISVEYRPVYYDNRIFYPDESTVRDIDISFIGSTYPNRLRALERVTQYVADHGLSMLVGGYWYKGRHWWKRIQFNHRHKWLLPYLENRLFSAEEAAAVYRRSKICLNINCEDHKSLNPRTFEILATKSFQLMDSGPLSHGLLDLSRDLCLYDDLDDMIEKIDYYLHHEQERQRIADTGFEHVKDVLAIQNHPEPINQCCHKREYV